MSLNKKTKQENNNKKSKKIIYIYTGHTLYAKSIGSPPSNERFDYFSNCIYCIYFIHIIIQIKIQLTHNYLGFVFYQFFLNNKKNAVTGVVHICSVFTPKRVHRSFEQVPHH